MLFAMGLNLQPNETAADVTAEAEDGAHNFYSLPVEYVGPVANQEWISSIVVRLNEEMTDVGDVLVAISYHGERSNRVRVGIGHIGDGLSDDAGAVPTPGILGAPAPALLRSCRRWLTGDHLGSLPHRRARRSLPRAYAQSGRGPPRALPR